MDSERILRTSIFGGFKREDVLQYVEELKSEILVLSEELKGKTAQLDSLQEKVDALSAECVQAKAAEVKLHETTAALEESQTLNAKLIAENTELSVRFASMDTEKASMERKAEEIRASEAQLGAAFLDARKYSDEIVSAANKKANETQSEASDSIAKQASEVARLSSDVDALAATLTKSIDDLHADISALSAKLSKAAQALQNRKDAEKFIPDISIKIEEDVSAADGGATVLRYPQSVGTTDAADRTIYRFDTPKEG